MRNSTAASRITRSMALTPKSALMAGAIGPRAARVCAVFLLSTSSVRCQRSSLVFVSAERYGYIVSALGRITCIAPFPLGFPDRFLARSFSTLWKKWHVLGTPHNFYQQRRARTQTRSTTHGRALETRDTPKRLVSATSTARLRLACAPMKSAAIVCPVYVYAFAFII